jgi:ParB family transcriptional regulator, chromosome partitioning protein
MQGKKKALGRGLSALLESPETDITTRDSMGHYVAGAVSLIPVSQIMPNPFQPRTYFDEAGLAELALSIQAQGIIQPVTLRKMGYDQYQLIAGERRLKAAKMTGLTEIPAYIRVANDEQMLEMALVENIHRSDLNPIEIGISYQRLIDECNIRQEDLSQKVGKDRSTVANYMRLLKLPSEIQVALRDGQITMGHARAMINVEDPHMQLLIFHKILSSKLSVRQVEETVRQQQNPKPATKEPMPERFEAARERLRNRMQLKVDIKPGKKGNGTIVIPFLSETELDDILSRLDA